MRVIMFQPRFIPSILDGTKRTTIRLRAGCRMGDHLSLRTWEGKPYRSKHRIIAEATCANTRPIQISAQGAVLGFFNLDAETAHELAVADGFAAFDEMAAWFAETYQTDIFTGELIEWEHLSTPGPASSGSTTRP